MDMLPNSLKSFHCPRWGELPELSLYMDQVLLVLDKALSPFSADGDYSMTTATMINNYVKQKVIGPPVKKKYEREHVAYLIMIGILKRVLSLSEIRGLIDMLLKEYALPDAYDRFCAQLENCIHNASGLTDYEGIAQRALRAALSALSNKLLLQQLLTEASSKPGTVVE